MAKQLTRWEIETIVIALEKYRDELEKVATPFGLAASIEGIDELGRHFTERLKNKSQGWGLQIDTRWA